MATVALSSLQAQPDPMSAVNQALLEKTGGVFELTFEERTRGEEKFGVNFGKSVNQQDMLSRLRLGMELQPVNWLKISLMGQDARVPFYGSPAPNTMRDTMDLQEAYVELFGGQRTGFGATFGRQMLNYGEARLIGSPQWSNISRTYDTGRIYYRSELLRLELLMVSPVRVQSDNFNSPELGERIWGTYDTLSGIWHGASVDLYALRHSQNRICGWSGTGTLGTDTFGGRFYGPLPGAFAYSLELIGQTGHVGDLSQRAWAWFAGASRKIALLDRPLGLSAEYKGASGTRAGSDHSSTFDQLSPANHDKFGHQDLFGWRNLKTFKALASWSVSKSLTLNLMYNNHWLYSASDALYNSQGSSIAVSKQGSAGTHVGQELDAFATYTYGPYMFGAGVGHFFKSEFLTNTTPGVNPRYFYIFQQYSFK